MQTLYKAFKAGAINEKELALAFIPNEERKNVAGKKMAKRFDSLEFDSEGNIISTRRPKTTPNKPVESTSKEEKPTTPAEPETTVESETEPEATLPPAPTNMVANEDGTFSVAQEEGNAGTPPTPPTPPVTPASSFAEPEPEEDPLLNDVIEFVRSDGFASAS